MFGLPSAGVAFSKAEQETTYLSDGSPPSTTMLTLINLQSFIVSPHSSAFEELGWFLFRDEH